MAVLIALYISAGLIVFAKSFYSITGQCLRSLRCLHLPWRRWKRKACLEKTQCSPLDFSCERGQHWRHFASISMRIGVGPCWISTRLWNISIVIATVAWHWLSFHGDVHCSFWPTLLTCCNPSRIYSIKSIRLTTATKVNKSPRSNTLQLNHCQPLHAYDFKKWIEKVDAHIHYSNIPTLEYCNRRIEKQSTDPIELSHCPSIHAFYFWQRNAVSK